ncbi:catechol 1,2-dioxygenase [Duganella qianjiadongensis]|uniref:catechol 1,2-dioxygenase n=1 Tax=Duganella qianjiadongensis TaxID=2692176 RepID=A0ABW9VE54_9BURK|nr:catechol 1,2-dioxygenase [Duganella qianjiadongensis]MYM37904.1 catechol 1,2-dioxygenase [Duganella qianjiadongensis]
MTHNEIDTLVKSWIIDSATGPVNPRVQQIVTGLVGALCKTIEDLDISSSEFWSGLEYLREAGVRNELGLLAPGLGLERFLDIRADEAEARAGLAGGTPRTIEGPLYVAGAPESVGFARLDDGTEADRAEVLFMQGTVRDEQGKPLANAKVEVWHCNLMGGYSYFDKTQSPFNLRRTIFTDAEGRYQFRSFLPVGYSCPPQGTTQRLLDQLGRHGNRPAHIHFFVTAEGQRKLTTQINIEGDKYLWDDFAFASREGLVPAVRHITDAAAISAKGLDKPYAEIDFDFNLYAERAAAPAAEVTRIRAAA